MSENTNTWNEGDSAILTEAGKTVRAKVKQYAEKSISVKQLRKEIAALCLTARQAVKRSDGIVDWRGQSNAYRTWYGDNVVAIIAKATSDEKEATNLSDSVRKQVQALVKEAAPEADLLALGVKGKTENGGNGGSGATGGGEAEGEKLPNAVALVDEIDAHLAHLVSRVETGKLDEKTAAHLVKRLVTTGDTFANLVAILTAFAPEEAEEEAVS